MKTFNTTGVCIPSKNYMVDLSSRLEQIKVMVDQGLYFTINRARQYGKTTTLTALRHALANDYDVISLDFQRVSYSDFSSEGDFVYAFCDELLEKSSISSVMLTELASKPASTLKMRDLFKVFKGLCSKAPKPIVLMIDEVDSATNNQVFLDFLARLRDSYLRRDTEGMETFQSVILAGVTDIKNLRRKIRPEDAHKFNSPWNIAADFNVDMSFNAADISGMLREYEADHGTGMDVDAVAQTIEAYTGQPDLPTAGCRS